MTTRNNTVLLFSKVPETGLVKTRLSILKDGMFPPKEAADLYRCMLLDVVDIICTALDDLDAAQTVNSTGNDVVEDSYELVVSTTPAANVTVMQELLDGEGYYTHGDVKVVIAIVHKREQLTFLRMVHELDPAAFVSQSRAEGVYGNGFNAIK